MSNVNSSRKTYWHLAVVADTRPIVLMWKKKQWMKIDGEKERKNSINLIVFLLLSKHRIVSCTRPEANVFPAPMDWLQRPPVRRPRQGHQSRPGVCISSTCQSKKKTVHYYCRPSPTISVAGLMMAPWTERVERPGCPLFPYRIWWSWHPAQKIPIPQHRHREKG